MGHKSIEEIKQLLHRDAELIAQHKFMSYAHEIGTRSTGDSMSKDLTDGWKRTINQHIRNQDIAVSVVELTTYIYDNLAKWEDQFSYKVYAMANNYEWHGPIVDLRKSYSINKITGQPEPVEAHLLIKQTKQWIKQQTVNAQRQGDTVNIKPITHHKGIYEIK